MRSFPGSLQVRLARAALCSGFVAAERKGSGAAGDVVGGPEAPPISVSAGAGPGGLGHPKSPSIVRARRILVLGKTGHNCVIKPGMAAPDGDQLELLALLHHHLVQVGYTKTARKLLQESGQKSFPSPPVSLQDIFAQWKKTCPQVEKQKADDTKKSIPAKIIVLDPKNSSESSDEEEASNAEKINTNFSVNKISVAKAETSSEDEDSSSEEEAVAGKVLKTPGTGNTTDFLQLVSKPGQKNAPLGEQGAPLQSPVVQGEIKAQAADGKKTSSESSSSSESVKEKTLTAVKSPPPQPALMAESCSKDSSDDSDSEEGTKAAVAQRLQTPQLPTGTKQSQNNKPGNLVKAALRALKGKKMVSESSSSGSEDEVVLTASKLLPLSATKTNTAGPSTSVTKPPSVLASLQKAQQSQDGGQYSSDKPDSEEDLVLLTQPPIHPFLKQMMDKGAKVAEASSSSTSVTPQKRAIKKAKSFPVIVIDSSDSDQEPSQSLLACLSDPVKPPVSIAQKNSSPALLIKNSTTSALAKTPGKPPPPNISSSKSSESNIDAEAETSMSFSGEPVVAKFTKGSKMVNQKESGSSDSTVSRAEKASPKAQSNDKNSGIPTMLLLLTDLSKAQPAEVGAEEAIDLALGAAGQEGAAATPVMAGQSLDVAKAAKKGEKKKSSKKRKLAAGDADLGETTGKKLKEQDDPEALAKKKKKAKSSDDTKRPKKKDGKEKADKKKRRAKRWCPLVKMNYRRRRNLMPLTKQHKHGSYHTK